MQLEFIIFVLEPTAMSKAQPAIKLYKDASLYCVERSTKWYVRGWDKKTSRKLDQDALINASLTKKPLVNGQTIDDVD